jgi:hypothetical protein
MKKLVSTLVLITALSAGNLLAADRYQQVFLKGPNQTNTINIAAGTVAYLFGASSIPYDFKNGVASGSVSAVCTVDGVSIPATSTSDEIREDSNSMAYSKTLILAGPASVSLTTAANTHAEIAFLWTILTRPNPNINGIKQ